MPLQEHRTSTKIFGSLPKDSPLLVNIPTAENYLQQKLHILAANGFNSLADAAKKELDLEVLAASGWRPHRWDSFKQYEDFVVHKYGSLKKGRLYLAFDSPHETGLAVDFNCGGLKPLSGTIELQKQTVFYKWLTENAFKYGWTPYLAECWHWEYFIDLESYKTGIMSVENLGPVYQAPPYCNETGNCVKVNLED